MPLARTPFSEQGPFGYVPGKELNESGGKGQGAAVAGAFRQLSEQSLFALSESVRRLEYCRLFLEI